MGFGIEGDIAGEADGAGDQFLAGAGGADDEGGEVAHMIEEDAEIAAKVGGENGIPDGRAELGSGHGAADDVAEDEVEGAADLEEAGEEMGGIKAGLNLLTGQIEEVIEVGKKFAIEVDLARGRTGRGGDEVFLQ